MRKTNKRDAPNDSPRNGKRGKTNIETNTNHTMTSTPRGYFLCQDTLENVPPDFFSRYKDLLRTGKLLQYYEEDPLRYTREMTTVLDPRYGSPNSERAQFAQLIRRELIDQQEQADENGPFTQNTNPVRSVNPVGSVNSIG